MLWRLGLAAILIVGCATAGGEGGGAPSTKIPGVPRGITFGGGDGLDCSRRVIIQGTDDERAGVSAEYAWLRAKYPGFKMRQQWLMKCDGKHADRLSITTANGDSLDVHFDISAFFGKRFGL